MTQIGMENAGSENILIKIKKEPATPQSSMQHKYGTSSSTQKDNVYSIIPKPTHKRARFCDDVHSPSASRIGPIPKKSKYVERFVGCCTCIQSSRSSNARCPCGKKYLALHAALFVLEMIKLHEHSSQMRHMTMWTHYQVTLRSLWPAIALKGRKVKVRIHDEDAISSNVLITEASPGHKSSMIVELAKSFDGGCNHSNDGACMCRHAPHDRI